LDSISTAGIKAGLTLLTFLVFGAKIKDSSLGKLRHSTMLPTVNSRQSIKLIVAVASLKTISKRRASFGYFLVCSINRSKDRLESFDFLFTAIS
jgi:hypothetical protein